MKEMIINHLEDISEELQELNITLETLSPLLKEYLTEAIEVKKLEKIIFQKNLELCHKYKAEGTEDGPKD